MDRSRSVLFDPASGGLPNRYEYRATGKEFVSLGVSNQLSTDANGNLSVEFHIPDGSNANQLAAGDFISAVATRVSFPGGSTSEMSAELAAQIAPRVSSVKLLRIGAPNSAYVPATGNGNQMKTVPVGGANAFIVRFTEPVSLIPIPSFVAVRGVRTGQVYPVTSITFGPTTWEYTIEFDNDANPATPLVITDQLELSLSENVVSSGTFVTIDGDWEDPSSISDSSSNLFGSGNGRGGCAFTYNVTLLPGDTDSDNDVDLDDFGAQKANFGKTSGATWQEGDFDGDGNIDLDDFGHLKANFGVSGWTSWPEAHVPCP